MTEEAKHRPFLRWPDPRLKARAEPIDAVTDDIRKIWDEMVAAMQALPGAGLAAPQLGVMLRLAVLDISGAAGPIVRLANPELLEASEELAEYAEGSPNLPGVWAKIPRPKRVKLRFLDESGEQVEREFEGLSSIAAQHQLDHLDGRMYFEHLKPIKRRMLLDKAKKAAKREAQEQA